MKRIVRDDLVDVVADIFRKLRIDLVEHILTVIERPHFADGFVANTRHDAADVLEHRIGRCPLVPPVLLRVRQFEANREAFAGFFVGHDIRRRRLVLHVVDAGADIDQRLDHRMGRHILDLFAVDINVAAVAQGLAVLLAGSDHRLVSSRLANRPAALLAVFRCWNYGSIRRFK